MIRCFLAWGLFAVCSVFEQYCSGIGGGDSSVGSVLGLAVLRDAALWVQPSSEPPVEGIFPLELLWVLTPCPLKKPLSDENINQGLLCARMHIQGLCARMHSVARIQKIGKC